VQLFTIAALTLREVVRRRLVAAIGLLTLISVGLTTWGFYKLTTLTGPAGHPIPHAELMLTVSFLVIFIAYGFSVILAVGASLLAAPSIAGDIESGIALAMLPRPLRRSDLLLGKWFGMTVLAVGYTAFVVAIELFLIKWVTGYGPPHPVEAMVFLAAEAVVMLSFTMLFSTCFSAITAGAIALVLFGLAWISGFVGMIGAQFNNRSITNVTTAISLVLPTDGMWRSAVYNLEPAAVIAAAHTNFAEAVRGAGPFTEAEPPPPAYLAWTGCWLIGVLGLAVWSFNRRDL
jgi:ABC-type transport system involved in multi-copper enzyme maturation permease subunit